MSDPVARRTFLMLGSGEFDPWVAEAEHLALSGATGDGSVVVLPTASVPGGDEVFERWARMAAEHYEAAGITARALPLKVREDAMREELVAQAEGASMVFFSGGKPQHLAGVMEGTPFWSAVLAAVGRGGLSHRLDVRPRCPSPHLVRRALGQGLACEGYRVLRSRPVVRDMGG